jgi:hypothetical protein
VSPKPVKPDLYFILNPYTGLIKVGISTDCDDRRCALEYACGVKLEVLAIAPAQGEWEKPIHEALHHSRQIGEWFIPTEDLLGIAEDPTTIPAFLERMAPQIMERRRIEEAEAEQERVERERVKQELLEARKEAARKEKEIKAKRAKAKQAREEKERARREADMEEWRTRERDKMLDACIAPDKAQEAKDRLEVVRTAQRRRNAAYLGVKL